MSDKQKIKILRAAKKLPEKEFTTMDYYNVPHTQTFKYKILVKVLKGEEAEDWKREQRTSRTWNEVKISDLDNFDEAIECD